MIYEAQNSKPQNSWDLGCPPSVLGVCAWHSGVAKFTLRGSQRSLRDRLGLELVVLVGHPNLVAE